MYRVGTFARVAILITSAGLAMASAAQAPDFPSRLTEEIARDRSTLDSLNHTEFTKGDAANIQTALADAEKHIQAKRPLIALEMLSSATPGTLGLKAAAAGWGQNGKGIEVLEADWKAAGEAMERDKKKFPTRAPAGQPMFVRAVAELSMGQVNENYAAAVDYGKVAGIQFGAYYLGRSQGHLAFALYSSGLASGENRKPFAPAVRRSEPIEAAIPIHIVDTAGRMYRMVSYIARPAETDPPGLFI